MIARYHYDDETLGSLLLDHPTDRPSELAEHVETCETCQERLETLTQEGLSWEEAGEFLRNDLLDEADDLSSGPLDAQPDNTFLQPSEHPGSLGKFGRYEVMEFLGRGGMGIVMRGYDPALNRYSAVKILAPELASSAAARKRFSREAKSAAAVVHPHVVPIQTVDQHAGLPYLVMPVVEGKSLQQRVDQEGPLPILEVVRIASQIADGLAAAHAQGLIHRDIKPANILLENGVERVQITDFGLARAADDASMTRSGVIAGTPQYMSPEQAHGDEIDHRSDLFSLGSVIYFMLTGRSPFRAENTMGVLNRIVNDPPRPLRSIHAEIPRWLEQIVMRLLEKSPDKRFESAEALRRTLTQHLNQLQDPAIERADLKPAWLGISSPPAKWLTLASIAIAGILAFTIIVLQTEQGTIRIETNDQLAHAVPIVIKQGDEIVERLVVDSHGAKTRVRAGSYSIEFEGEGTSFQLDSNQATVTAGGVWTTKITHEPQQASWKDEAEPSSVRGQALNDAQHGRYDASLEKILWCWDNADQADPAWSAVRRSFLLADWLTLGEKHPPALAKLTAIRDALETRILSQDQIRVSLDDFADFATINRTLRDEERTHRIFDQVARRDPEDAKRLKSWLPTANRQAEESLAPPQASRPQETAEAGSRTDSENKGLTEAVSEFNRHMNAYADFDQPELTEQEVLTCALWNLEYPEQLSEETLRGLRTIATERRLPRQWKFDAGYRHLPPFSAGVNGYQILLYDYQLQSIVEIRQRFLSVHSPMDQPIPASALNTIPLNAAITEFNAMHNTIDGMRQPPITIDEVIAAITHWASRRDAAPVDNATFQSFLNIAQTRSLPADAQFEVIPSFGTQNGATYNIWSVRIRLPFQSKPGNTFAFTIRKQFISATGTDSPTIHWGTPADNGFQVGVRLTPTQRNYQIGQTLGTEFYFRSITENTIGATLPNWFTFKSIEVTDEEGNAVAITALPRELIVGGVMETQVGEKPTRKVARQTIRLVHAGEPDGTHVTLGALDSRANFSVQVTPGESYSMQFKVANFSTPGEGDLTTGKIEFHVID
ncbi:serine/threonine-protein kinase [Aureliella helgolandensis]|uniref:non-specific serine/threonine protein kinase n=1 Tax=Aureliella helgolandensis TaxID=2527968 RepID=A0A518FZU0_9BACT|nr:serine/threonine-protein kinase [Aureliella helgolandensis]QDV21872.1 Serine/threonine-protein kinase PknB [Aureliella helgolandensis]